MKNALFAPILVSPLSTAQIRIAEAHGEEEWELVGCAVLGLEDMNGDGMPDLVAGSLLGPKFENQAGCAQVDSDAFEVWFRG